MKIADGLAVRFTFQRAIAASLWRTGGQRDWRKDKGINTLYCCPNWRNVSIINLDSTLLGHVLSLSDL